MRVDDEAQEPEGLDAQRGGGGLVAQRALDWWHERTNVRGEPAGQRARQLAQQHEDAEASLHRTLRELAAERAGDTAKLGAQERQHGGRRNRRAARLDEQPRGGEHVGLDRLLALGEAREQRGTERREHVRHRVRLGGDQRGEQLRGRAPHLP